MAMNMVGTPWTAVQFFVTSASMTFLALNISIGTKGVPWDMQDMSASTMPKQWKNGTVMHSLSSWVNFMPSPIVWPLLSIL